MFTSLRLYFKIVYKLFKNGMWQLPVGLPMIIPQLSKKDEKFVYFILSIPPRASIIKMMDKLSLVFNTKTINIGNNTMSIRCFV